MKKILLFMALLVLPSLAFAQEPVPDAGEILRQIDANMSANTQIIDSTMIVHGKRNDRSMTLRTYTRGDKDGFSEYFSPAREAGTKMLKLGDEMWVYSPSTDRTIMISGHMLRQSVMGSDMSYEDVMEDRKLYEMYTAVIIGSELCNDRPCWVLELTSIVDDASYPGQKLWVDKEYLLPLRQELYAKSGQLLKEIEMGNVQMVQGRWYPMWMLYRDVLGEGNGTEMIIDSITFDPEIPEHVFNKAGLR